MLSKHLKFSVCVIIKWPYSASTVQDVGRLKLVIKMRQLATNLRRVLHGDVGPVPDWSTSILDSWTSGDLGFGLLPTGDIDDRGACFSFFARIEGLKWLHFGHTYSEERNH